MYFATFCLPLLMLLNHPNTNLLVRFGFNYITGRKKPLAVRYTPFLSVLAKLIKQEVNSDLGKFNAEVLLLKTLQPSFSVKFAYL